MAAPTENQFWKLRSKTGRKKLFETPELLLEACREYFNWVDAHPWYKPEQLKKPYEEEYTDPKGKKQKRMVYIAKVPTARPYTIQGLCIYLDCNTLWFNQFEKAIQKKIEDMGEKNADETTLGFSKILAHVRDIIYQQKFEGAAVGAFNASIIQRDLSLIDRTDITTKGNEVMADKSDDELKQLLQDTLTKLNG